jgi:NAD-dependent SIR2 family protein deacetylase
MTDIPLVQNIDGSIIPPQCKNCGRLVLPMALFFDECYQTHRFFRYNQAISWLSNADAVVFVGTSLSVGITHQALTLSRGKTFFFNTEASGQLLETSSIGFASRNLDVSQSETDEQMFDVIGPCETTLNMLRKLVC